MWMWKNWWGKKSEGRLTLWLVGNICHTGMRGNPDHYEKHVANT